MKEEFSNMKDDISDIKRGLFRIGNKIDINKDTDIKSKKTDKNLTSEEINRLQEEISNIKELKNRLPKMIELNQQITNEINGLFIDDAIELIKYKYKNYYIQIIRYNSCITYDWVENRIRIMLAEDGLTAIYTSIG